jgi:predicted GNAT family N-acyltransferase
MSRLRSKIFSPVPGYNEQYPETEIGLQCDQLDTKSINFGYFKNQKIIGTVRLNLDSNFGLQSEEFCKPLFNNFRTFGKVAEIGRICIVKSSRSGMVFKELYKKLTNQGDNLNIQVYVGSSSQELKNNIYEKFGIQNVLDFEKFGHIQVPTSINYWNRNNFTQYYKSKILGEKNE